MAVTFTFRSLTRLEFERRRRCWTQTDLAYHVRLHQGQISLIECGRRPPTEEEAARIGHVLGVRPESLLEPVSLETHPNDAFGLGDLQVPSPPSTDELTERIRNARAAEQQPKKRTR